MNRRVLLGAIILALLPLSVAVSALVAPVAQEPRPTVFSTDAADFSRWNEQVNAAGFKVQSVVSDPALIRGLDHPETTMVIVPQPRQPPSDDTMDAWTAHLEHGGSLLIMDAAGVTNGFLSTFHVAVADRTVIDLAGDPDSTVAVRPPEDDGPGAPLAGQAPSALIINPDVEDAIDWNILLQSGESSYLDIGEDGQVDREDIPGPHVVAARLDPPNGGRLIVMTSTTFIANHFMEEPSVANSVHVFDLIMQDLPAGGTVLFDESHHGWVFPENVLATLVRGLSFAAHGALWAASAWVLVGVVLTFLVMKNSGTHPLRPHELATAAVDPMDLGATAGFYGQMATELRTLHLADDAMLRAFSNRDDFTDQDKTRLLNTYNSKVTDHA